MKKIIEIDSSNYTKFQNLDVIGFSLAHAGAQGEGGCIKIVDSNGKLYHTNICNSIKLREAFTVCPPLKGCSFKVLGTTVPNGWTYFYMGGGNFLVVKKSFAEHLQKLPPNELYWRWSEALIGTIGKENIKIGLYSYLKGIFIKIFNKKF